MEKRKYPDHPLVGVGAVIIGGERVILIRRGKEPGYGRWSIPGGAVKLGESLREALTREVREETGLEVTVGLMIEVLDRIVKDNGGRVAYHYVLIDYVCSVCGGQLAPDTDALEVCWVRKEEIGFFDLPEITRAVIEKAWKIDKNN
ncbi:MAG: NUDIX hydrolase [Deltaproteobacteria bacterium]|nr:NUDIX hydrolase [Deltaproteobacteria bacterium]